MNGHSMALCHHADIGYRNRWRRYELTTQTYINKCATRSPDYNHI